MICLEKTIDEYVESGILEHIAVRVGKNDDVIYDTYRRGVDELTLFDMASVTKIMVTTSLALIAIDRGLLQLNDKVDKFYPTEKPFTIEHLLTHTIGIGHKSLNKEGNTYENIAEKILDIPSDIPIGSDVRYSCPGFILLGKILEKIYDKPLEKSFDEMVAVPLGFDNTTFLPKERHNIVNSNLDKEKIGIVNDYNCEFLGGIAGNAGLFSNVSDVTKYVKFLQNKGNPFVHHRLAF